MTSCIKFNANDKKITLPWAHDHDDEYFSVLNQNFNIATVMFPYNRPYHGFRRHFDE